MHHWVNLALSDFSFHCYSNPVTENVPDSAVSHFLWMWDTAQRRVGRIRAPHGSASQKLACDEDRCRILNVTGSGRGLEAATACRKRIPLPAPSRPQALRTRS